MAIFLKLGTIVHLNVTHKFYRVPNSLGKTLQTYTYSNLFSLFFVSSIIEGREAYFTVSHSPSSRPTTGRSIKTIRFVVVTIRYCYRCPVRHFRDHFFIRRPGSHRGRTILSLSLWNSLVILNCTIFCVCVFFILQACSYNRG